MPNKQDRRFETIYSQGLLGIYQIIVDTETGVNYLLATNGVSGGVTVLLDSDGKPVIRKK